MAILCIRIKPNDSIDTNLNLFRTHEGDVVCIKESDHQFTRIETQCGQYRFITVLDAIQAEMIYLVDPQVDAQERMTRIRARGLDMAALNSANWKNKTTATKAEIDAIVTTRTVSI